MCFAGGGVMEPPTRDEFGAMQYGEASITIGWLDALVTSEDWVPVAIPWVREASRLLTEARTTDDRPRRRLILHDVYAALGRAFILQGQRP